MKTDVAASGSPLRKPVADLIESARRGGLVLALTSDRFAILSVPWCSQALKDEVLARKDEIEQELRRAEPTAAEAREWDLLRARRLQSP